MCIYVCVWEPKENASKLHEPRRASIMLLYIPWDANTTVCYAPFVMSIKPTLLETCGEEDKSRKNVTVKGCS